MGFKMKLTKTCGAKNRNGQPCQCKLLYPNRPLPVPWWAKHRAEDIGRKAAVTGGDASGLQGVEVKTVTKWALGTT